MAQIRHPLFVSITGKIDNMVFYRRNGKVFLRRLPVRKKRKPSESQLSHRRQFTAIIPVCVSAWAPWRGHIA